MKKKQYNFHPFRKKLLKELDVAMGKMALEWAKPSDMDKHLLLLAEGKKGLPGWSGKTIKFKRITSIDE